MGYHTFDASRADKLEQAGRRYRFLSAEELLWALSLSPDDTVADLGSGTGFFTNDVAPHADEVYAVDVQEEMHEYYREKGVSENVDLVTSDVSDLPFDDGDVDAAFSTMTYHEFASDDALAEIRRVLAPDRRLIVVDWRRPEPANTDRRSTSDRAPTKRRPPSEIPGSVSNTRPSDRRPTC